jgi:superfamily I DNA/RNA helicase
MKANLIIKVAISADFLKSFSQIPNAQQKKVREFVDHFQHNPTASSINYENINVCIDPNLHSVRIDQTYRAIILKPQTGNVYMLLWVDKHDAAYQWAARKKLIIHPDTGGIQIVQVEEKKTMPEQVQPEVIRGMFADFKDRQLHRLGVPEELLPSVRKVSNEQELDQLESILPQEAYEGLFMLACGTNYDDVIKEYELAASRAVDPSNFSAALENYDSQRRFKVVADSLELQELLNAPLEQWRVFLHPTQRRLVEMNANGPVRVLGSAGTGKTVVAVHRAKWLATSVFNKENDRILFTTYTKNLAADIQEYLRAICAPDVLKRIEVINLDAWTSIYLKKSGYDATIDYDGKTQKKLWADALNVKSSEYELPDAFYRDEWEQVIQTRNITSLSEYIQAPRTGRGRRLDRKMRNAAWPVFEEYRASLNEHNIKEVEDTYRDCRSLLADQGNILGYRAILVDEGQDFSAEAFRLLRQMIPESLNDLFIVGDAHQRLYGYQVILSGCGIRIQGRSRKLRINYRTTDETRRFATNILHDLSFDDLDGNSDDNSGCKSLTHGPVPFIIQSKDINDEQKQILEILKKIQADGSSLHSVCLTCRTNSLVDQYALFLKQTGIPHCIIKSNATHNQGQPGVRLATMHRVKGIEFDYIIIGSANKDIIPLMQAITGMDNDVACREAEKKERSLLYVALTRARKIAFITYYGEKSPFLP